MGPEIATTTAADKRNEEGIELEERILLQGYSASGMFVNCFAVLHRRVGRRATAKPDWFQRRPPEDETA